MMDVSPSYEHTQGGRRAGRFLPSLWPALSSASEAEPGSEPRLSVSLFHGLLVTALARTPLPFPFFLFLEC